MDLANQIKQHKELSKQIEKLEEQKKALGLSIMQQMKTKTLQVPGYLVRHCSRLSFNLTLEEARSFNAIKHEEVVDKDKLKTIYHSGRSIQGVSEIHYIQILELTTTTV